MSKRRIINNPSNLKAINSKACSRVEKNALFLLAILETPYRLVGQFYSFLG